MCDDYIGYVVRIDADVWAGRWAVDGEVGGGGMGALLMQNISSTLRRFF